MHLGQRLMVWMRPLQASQYFCQMARWHHHLSVCTYIQYIAKYLFVILTPAGLCYLAKHVELNYKGEGGNPFSIRQMAVHHSFDEMSNVHTFVVINPSITFQKHLGEARKLSNHTTRWVDMHIAVAYAMSSGWRKYVSYLEKEFGKTVGQSLF